MRRCFAFRFIAAVLCLVLIWPQTGWANDMHVCADPKLHVQGPSRQDPADLCAIAARARDAVSVCGLEQRQPVGIQVVDNLVHDFGPCLASFDCDRNVINILDPDVLPDRIATDDLYQGMPVWRVFESLLAHEMAHMLLHQMASGRTIPLVDHEFVATALEFNALDPPIRDAMVADGGTDRAATRDSVSVVIYAFAPRLFSVASWRYFERHGCAPVSGIVAGTFSFHEER